MVWDTLYTLKKTIEREGWKGYDPYDALNSPLLRMLSFRQKYGRIFWTQFMKHLPVNMRPFMGVSKKWNAKGLGLLLGSYARLDAFLLKKKASDEVESLLDLLDQNRSPGYHGNCWGYPFDWQSRAFYLRAGTPTIVNTSFIGHALLEVYELFQHPRALEMALQIPPFILQDLNREQTDAGICFSYSPEDHTKIHNANLLGAAFLARCSQYQNKKEYKATALQAVNYSLQYQSEEGGWYYAETSFQSWIDSFHTGFNLQSLWQILQLVESDELQQAFDKGLSFYMKNFFLEDGTAKYYHDRMYPLDIHCPSQALVLFSLLGEPYRERSKRVLDKMIEEFFDPRGYFIFQKNRFFRNRIQYMRWAQAWAFHALTSYLVAYEDPKI